MIKMRHYCFVPYREIPCHTKHRFQREWRCFYCNFWIWIDANLSIIRSLFWWEPIASFGPSLSVVLRDEVPLQRPSESGLRIARSSRCIVHLRDKINNTKSNGAEQISHVSTSVRARKIQPSFGLKWFNTFFLSQTSVFLPLFFVVFTPNGSIILFGSGAATDGCTMNNTPSPM